MMLAAESAQSRHVGACSFTTPIDSTSLGLTPFGNISKGYRCALYHPSYPACLLYLHLIGIHALAMAPKGRLRVGMNIFYAHFCCCSLMYCRHLVHRQDTGVNPKLFCHPTKSGGLMCLLLAQIYDTLSTDATADYCQVDICC